MTGQSGMSRIKVFLGAFVNNTNAQNINCRELAKHFDTSKFEIYTLQLSHGNLQDLKARGVHIFNCGFPVKITGRLGYLWGFLKSDVVYLPRADFLKWQKILLKIFKRKSLKTIENIIDEEAISTALSIVGQTFHQAVDYYQYCDQNHPITAFLGEYNLKHHGLNYDLPVLGTPTDTRLFQNSEYIRPEEFSDLIFVGNDFVRKRLSEFIELANNFPELNFHVVGRGEIESFKSLVQHDNVKFHGVLKHDELVDIFHQVHLHFLPSRSEGFGKITIECGAAGVPSIVYGSYGASEWMSAEDGIIVDTFDQVVESVGKVQSDQQHWNRLSEGAKRMSQRFDSSILVKSYEEVIEKINSKR